MRLTINFVSIFLLKLAFISQSQQTVGLTSENVRKPNLFSEANPLLHTGQVQVLDSQYEKNDNPILGENQKDYDLSVGSLEKDIADVADSLLSSSSSSEESDTFLSTFGTTSRPFSNKSSAALEQKLNLRKKDTVRLIKPRDSRKSDNWYDKRSASVSASISLGGETKGRKGGEGREGVEGSIGGRVYGGSGNSGSNMGTGGSGSNRGKGDSEGSIGGRVYGGSGSSAKNRGNGVSGRKKGNEGSGGNRGNGDSRNNKIEGGAATSIGGRVYGGTGSRSNNKANGGAGKNRGNGGGGENGGGQGSIGGRVYGGSLSSATNRGNGDRGNRRGNAGGGKSGGGQSNGGTRTNGGSRGSTDSGAGTKQRQQDRIKQQGRNVGGTADDDGLNKTVDVASILDHYELTGLPSHNKTSETNGSVDATKGKKDPFKNNADERGRKIGGNILVNKTSIKPYNVERATRPIDPDFYSFFQFKPRESIGLLWTQSANLFSGMFGGMFGRRMENEEEDEDQEDVDDPSILFDWEFKRYDRACLYLENNVNKAQLNSTQVTEETTRMVDTQNENLARRFLDWQFVNKEDHETIALNGEGENHPHFVTYKFLTMTMEIFRDKICRNATPYATAPEVKHFAPLSTSLKAETNKKYLDGKLIPKTFIDDLYRLFLTLRDITLPKGIPDYASKKDEEDIYSDVLENCLKLDPIQWYSHTCADQVLSYDNPHNYACTPLVEYDFNPKEYDPILDGMWHMFTAVHGFCFEEFNKRNIRLWHKYSMIIVNSFTVGMRKRWQASIAESKFYIRLLGADYKIHLETMNRCMFAATLQSGAPAVLPRFLSVSSTSFERERTLGKDASESHPKS